jgi:uncharacterized protein (DUF697 family)
MAAEGQIQATIQIEEKYQEPIRTAVQAALIISPTGVLVPGLSNGAMLGIWTTMIVSIANKSGHQMTPEVAAKLAGTLLSSILLYRLALRVLIALVRLFPGMGKSAAVLFSTALNTYFTYRLGLAMVKQFDRPDFDVESIIEFSSELVQVIIKRPTADELREIRDLIA